jgi:hypothetical protein
MLHTIPQAATRPSMPTISPGPPKNSAQTASAPRALARKQPMLARLYKASERLCGLWQDGTFVPCRWPLKVSITRT